MKIGEDESSPERLTADHLTKWLDEYLLPANAPRPTRETLEVLANEINFIAERPGGAGDPVLEEISRRLMAMQAAASNYRVAYSDCVEMAVNLGGDPRWTAADEMFAELGVPPIPSTTAAPRRGRPKEEWHPFGHFVAGKISAAMRHAGYRGSLSKKVEESITVAISAATVTHICQMDPPLKPGGFASAMKHRRRGKNGTGDHLTFSNLMRVRKHRKDLALVGQTIDQFGASKQKKTANATDLKRGRKLCNLAPGACVMPRETCRSCTRPNDPERVSTGAGSCTRTPTHDWSRPRHTGCHRPMMMCS